MNSLCNLNFDPDFFCDETREGFFVSETMKHYWAAQLQVLSEIDRICRKHGCNWFADCGTLLGCVRHKGYIPWDDDIDIAMRRNDMDVFLKYAREELPEGYVVLDANDIEGYNLPFCRITNSKVINAGAKFLSTNHGCPFVAGVDIFPLDNIYHDQAKEEDRTKRGKYVYETFTGILGKKYSDAELGKRIQKIEDENNTPLDCGKDLCRDLLILFDRIAAEANNEEASEIAVMYMWVSKGSRKYSSFYYEKYIELPFENTLLRAPENYHEVLTKTFGDYRTVVRGSAIHTYPVYRELEEIYRRKFGKNPTRYSFDRDDYTPPETRTPYKQQQKEILRLLLGIHERIGVLLGECNDEEIISFFQSCQNAAVSVGTAIENKFGSGTDTVKMLEDYCEKIYVASAGWNEAKKLDLDNAVLKIDQSLDRLYETEKKDVLFLPCKVSWWDTMKDAFLKADADECNRVKVIPIPYFYHDHEKMLGESKADTDEFELLPELKGKITSFEEYKLESRHPEMIVIQFPFDGYSGILSVSKLLYTENLLQYTDKLVYIPFAAPDPPISENDIVYDSLLDLIEQPAVFYADTVVVSSPKLRECYIKKLTEMTDESMHKFWEDRIVTGL